MKLVTHSYLGNYANDNKLYCFDNNINDVNDKLRINLAQVMKRFNENNNTANIYLFVNCKEKKY